MSAQRALQTGAHRRGPTVSLPPPPGRRSVPWAGAAGGEPGSPPPESGGAETPEPLPARPTAREARQALPRRSGRGGARLGAGAVRGAGLGGPGGGVRGGDWPADLASWGWGSSFLQRLRACGFIIRRSSAGEGRAGGIQRRERSAAGGPHASPRTAARGAAPEGAERRAPGPARAPRRPDPRPRRARPGPGSMRRAALWLSLCALALRLQPVLPVSAAAASGRRREAGPAEPPMPAAARGGGGEPGTWLLPALARRRCAPKPGRPPQAPPPSVGAGWAPPLRVRGWGAPRDAACGGPRAPAPHPSPRAPRWPGPPPVTREDAVAAATRPSRRPQLKPDPRRPGAGPFGGGKLGRSGAPREQAGAFAKERGPLAVGRRRGAGPSWQLGSGKLAPKRRRAAGTNFWAEVVLPRGARARAGDGVAPGFQGRPRSGPSPPPARLCAGAARGEGGSLGPPRGAGGRGTNAEPEAGEAFG